MPVLVFPTNVARRAQVTGRIYRFLYLLSNLGIPDRPPLQDGAGPSVEGEYLEDDLGRLAGAGQPVVLVVRVQDDEGSSA